MPIQYQNAVEDWPLYDSVLIASNVDQLYKNSGFLTSYAALANFAEIPFFNTRNKSVGVQYCNMDSANKMPFVYHLEEIGISFHSPLGSYQAGGGTPPRTELSDAFFSADLYSHCGFIFKVAQDEKLVADCGSMPDGEGIKGWAGNQSESTSLQFVSNQTFSQGEAEVSLNWKFPKPISIPRDQTIEGKLVLSNDARTALTKMVGPGLLPLADTGIDTAPQAALIKVTMYGKREVQQRNALHK